MNKEESLALYEKGVEAWNIWANEMLAKKAALEEKKEWQITAPGKEGNQVTREWLRDSKVNFNKHTFEGKVDFDNFIFPNLVRFVDTIFTDNVTFESAIFRGKVYFNRARFHANAWLKSTEFSKYTVFDSVEFSGYARFHNAVFKDEVLFDQIVFKGSADFSNTIFVKKVSFIAIQGQSFFSLKGTKFHLAPDFNQAHFIEAPQFEETDFSIAKKNGQHGANSNNSITSRWRSLKRLAVQAHDHKSELFFFAEEIKSQRGIQDKVPNSFDYLKSICSVGNLLGYLYQLFSDFGRSVIRPLLWLLGLGVVFYIIYLNYSIEDNPINQCERSGAAIYLSLRSALPFIPATSYSEKINQSYACLYGKANIPNPVIFFSIAQTILSTILIFLTLLALRNHFRIK